MHIRLAAMSAIALFSIAAARPLSAQAIHPGKQVRVYAPGVLLERFEGVYIGRSGDTVTFGNDERGPVQVPAGAITALDVSHGLSRWRGALRGALWGALSLAAVSALLTTDPLLDTEGMSQGEFIIGGAVNGAALGAIIGAFVPARVWRSADPRLLLSASRAAGAGPTAMKIGLAF